jgi:hypothetical protein
MKNNIEHSYNTRRKVKIIKAIKYIQRNIRGQLVRKKIYNLRKCNICSICLEKILYLDCVLLFGCNHIFHKNCLNTWIAVNCTCPNCRAEILHLPPKKSHILLRLFRRLFYLPQS